VKIPHRIEPLVEAGLVDSVSRQLMSGKEAVIYAVRCGEDLRCAKIYKEADRRSFRRSVDVDGVMRLVDDALKEEAARRRYLEEIGQK